MARRPESRWFVVGVYAEVVLGLMLGGAGGAAMWDRASRRLFGGALVAGGVVLVALGARGLYRWRVRAKNGHGGR